MHGGTQKARFASMLLKDKACTWFMVQGYAFDDEDDEVPLTWHTLKEHLLTPFHPADHKQIDCNE